MKRLVIFINIALLILYFSFLGSFCAESQAKEPFVLKFSTALPPQAPPAVYMKKMIDSFNKRVEGRLSFIQGVHFVPWKKAWICCAPERLISWTFLSNT